MTSMMEETQAAQYRGFRNNRRSAVMAGLVGILLILAGGFILHWDRTHRAPPAASPAAHE